MTDPAFDKFCKDLERLKSQTTLYKPRAGITFRIIQTIQNDSKRLARRSFRTLLIPLGVASLLVLGWFWGTYLRQPVASTVGTFR